MDRYKFGNNICRLREQKGFTQEQFAKELDVTDKAVSKWENGQSIPRMETLETIAELLETTVDALILAGKDNCTVICIKNDYTDILHLEIDGKPYSIGADESQWVDVNPDGFKVKVTGVYSTEEIIEDLQQEEKTTKGVKDKLALKVVAKFMREAPNLMLFVNCVYRCSELSDGDVITIKSDCLDLGDKALTFRDFLIMYPLIEGNKGVFELENCYADNKESFIKNYQKTGLWSDLGLGFLWMFLGYPIRGLYFKHFCKPKTIKKYILNAEKYRAKEETENEKEKKHKGIGCLSMFFIFVFLVIFACCMDFVLGFVFIDSAKPALVAADYSQITYYDGLLKGESVYTRIDELPENAYYDAEPLFGASVWYDARTDGLSRFDQMLQDDMVCLYKDNDGNKYLWLVEDYGSVEFDDYDDFDEHYVYMLKAENE